jgi:hypothetical protein
MRTATLLPVLASIWVSPTGCAGNDDDNCVPNETRFCTNATARGVQTCTAEGDWGYCSIACSGRPSGFYEASYTERSGTCGELTTAIIDLDASHWSTGGLPQACTGGSNESGDHCTWEVSMSCPADRTPQLDVLCEQFDMCDPPPVFTFRSTTTWQSGFAEGDATVSSSLNGTGGDCSGLYDVHLLRR